MRGNTAAVVVAAFGAGAAVAKEQTAWMQEVHDRELRLQRAKQIAAEMPVEEAFAVLGAKRNTHRVSMLQTTSNMQKAELTLEVAKVAMTELNNMYLEYEAELDDALFACEHRTEELMGAIEDARQELEATESEKGDCDTATTGATANKGAAENAHAKLVEDEQALTSAFEEQRQEDQDDLREKQVVANAWSLILEMSQCSDGGSSLLQHNTVELMTCKAQDEMADDSFVSMFANPEFQRKVNQLLNQQQQRQLSNVLGEVARNADEKLENEGMMEGITGAAKEAPNADGSTDSFLQISGMPNSVSPSKSCQGVKADCSILSDKVGLMWGDATDAVDVQESEMLAKLNEYNEMMAMIQAGKDAEIAEAEMMGQVLAARKTEAMTLMAAQGAIETRMHDLGHELNQHNAKCAKDIETLKSEGVCAVLAVRGKVLAKCASVLTIKKIDDINDCEMEEWAAVGTCENSKNELVDCYKPDTVRTGESFARPSSVEWEGIKKGHTQKYERGVAVAPMNGGADNLGALPCPQRLEKNDLCHQFKLCGVPCVTSGRARPGACTKECGGGFQSVSRSVVQSPKFGGDRCEPLTELHECNTYSCDVDCALTRWPRFAGGCVRGCKDNTDKMLKLVRPNNNPFRVAYRVIARHAKGKGRCWKRWSKKRVVRYGCNRFRCRFDEVCWARMDIVLGVDASGSLKGTNFKVLTNFTAEIVKRFHPNLFGFPGVRAGVVVFGNGALNTVQFNGKDKQIIRAAEVLSPPVNDFPELQKVILAAEFKGGFSNAAQGITAMCKQLNNHGRRYATRKVVMVTDGRPAGSFKAMESAAECKSKGIVVDIILINAAFNKNGGAWQGMLKIPSYPWQAHLHVINGVNELASSTVATAQRMLPRVCPRATTVGGLIRWFANVGWMYIHYGRDCETWAYYLGSFTTARQCSIEARAQGFKSFVFERRSWRRDRRGEYQCYSHPTLGKKDPVKNNNPFNYVDDTCNCDHWSCGKVGEKVGWMSQRMASFWFSGFSHIMVIDNAATFREQAFSNPWVQSMMPASTQTSSFVQQEVQEAPVAAKDMSESELWSRFESGISSRDMVFKQNARKAFRTRMNHAFPKKKSKSKKQP